MIIEALRDEAIFFNRTGRVRFRNDRKGRLILQVEYSYPDRDGDSILAWRDAEISDIQWREE
mgnify:CR=1 FL=1